MLKIDMSRPYVYCCRQAPWNFVLVSKVNRRLELKDLTHFLNELSFICVKKKKERPDSLVNVGMSILSLLLPPTRDFII